MRSAGRWNPSPRRAPGLVARAAHLQLAAGAAAEAEAAFRRAIALQADRADVHFGLSLALSNQGRHAEALAAARAGHAAHPGDIDLATHFGHLLNAGTPADRAEAETVFRAVLAGHPGTGRALFGLSSVLAWRGDLQRALPLAERAVLRMPGNAEALAWLARLVLDTGNPDRAERMFRRVLRMVPPRADGFLGLADAMHATGRTAEAITILGRGIAKFPDEPSLPARRAELAAPPPAPPAVVPERRKPWWRRLLGRMRRRGARHRPPGAPGAP